MNEQQALMDKMPKSDRRYVYDAINIFLGMLWNRDIQIEELEAQNKSLMCQIEDIMIKQQRATVEAARLDSDNLAKDEAEDG